MVNREKIIGTNITYAPYPEMVRALNVPELDFLGFDFEHMPYTTESIAPLLRMCRDLDLPTVVRVQDAIYNLIAKPVDFGADFIMIPRTETMEQVEIGIKSMWFKPYGYKGLNGILLQEGETYADIFSICRNRQLIPQIESPEGVGIIPEIFERYGDKVHCVIIGPGDLSVSVGHPGQIECKESREQIELAMKYCDKYNKSCGIYCGSAEDAQKWYARGMNILWTSDELSWLARGYKVGMEKMLNAKRP